MLNAIRTPGGHPLLHVVSALQKAIRRSNTDDALYWAVQMHLAGYHEYCWKRLKIICSEDIGPASPYLPAQIETLYNTYTWYRAKHPDDRSEAWRLFFVHAVILLAQAPKSRICDHALMVYFNSDRKFPSGGNGKAEVESGTPPAAKYALAVAAGKVKDGQPLSQGGWRPIPDYCLDRHSPEGRRKGRGWEHFFTEGSKLVNSDGTEPSSDQYREAAHKIMVEIEQKADPDDDSVGEKAEVISEVERSGPTKGSGRTKKVPDDEDQQLFGF